MLLRAFSVMVVLQLICVSYKLLDTFNVLHLELTHEFCTNGSASF